LVTFQGAAVKFGTKRISYKFKKRQVFGTFDRGRQEGNDTESKKFEKKLRRKRRLYTEEAQIEL